MSRQSKMRRMGLDDFYIALSDDLAKATNDLGIIKAFNLRKTTPWAEQGGKGRPLLNLWAKGPAGSGLLRGPRPARALTPRKYVSQANSQ